LRNTSKAVLDATKQNGKIRHLRHPESSKRKYQQMAAMETAMKMDTIAARRALPKQVADPVCSGY